MKRREFITFLGVAADVDEWTFLASWLNLTPGGKEAVGVAAQYPIRCCAPVGVALPGWDRRE